MLQTLNPKPSIPAVSESSAPVRHPEHASVPGRILGFDEYMSPGESISFLGVSRLIHDSRFCAF